MSKTPVSKLLIGIDIGGTKSAVILGTDAGEVLKRVQIETGPWYPTVRKLLENAKYLFQGKDIRACGISCGGPLSSKDGLILSPPNLPGWDRVPIVEDFRKLLGVPTALENDANASALAEWKWGLNQSVDNLIYLTCGTGQGAGLMLNGQLYRGREDLAGEIGHVRLAPSGPVGYHKAGSVEGLTAGPALAAIADLRRAEPHEKSSLDAVADLTGKHVGEAAMAGDALAVRVVRELADNLGQTCAILIDLLNPQRISLGSLATRLGPLLLDGVRAAAKRESLPGAFEACTIDASVLGDRVQDLAALAAAPKV